MSFETGPSPSAAMQRVFASHERQWRTFAYVYPVISRRSSGLSIGINLNPNKACNFDCVYCNVDRSVAPVRETVDLDQVRFELKTLLDLTVSGALWQDDQFRAVLAPYRRLNDLAFSGDGEPTTYAHFDQAVELVASLKADYGLDQTKMVLITNATVLERPKVRKALAVMDRHHGEVWAKLDAGGAAYYQQVDRSRVPLAKVVANVIACARLRPVTIQTMLMKQDGQAMPDDEFERYLGLLDKICSEGGQINMIQLYTVARRTAEVDVTPLETDQLECFADRLRRRLPEVPVSVYPGVS